MEDEFQAEFTLSELINQIEDTEQKIAARVVKINTNPRTEQTVVTFSKELADFYFEFYSGITSFDKEWH